MSDQPNTGERNAEADLAIVNAATPGPWIQQMDGWTVRVDTGEDAQERGPIVALTYQTGLPIEEQVANSQFIAEARQGWEWWIARAQELLKENNNLHIVLTEANDTIERMSRDEDRKDGES